MARVKLSAFVADISGKINGTVFQRNQGGLCMRNQSGKINSNTARSNLHRVGMSTVQVQWQQLTNAQRLLWQTYAVYLNKKQKKSQSLIVNGHQLFLNINSIRFDLSTENSLFQPYLLTTPVLAPLPLPINILSVVRNGVALEFNLDRAVGLTNVIILFLSAPLLGSQMSAHRKLILMKSPTNTGTLFECNAAYVNVYGRVPEVGEYIQTKIAIYDTAAENYSSFSVQRFEVQ